MNEYRYELLDLSTGGIREISTLLISVFGKGSGLTDEFVDWEYNGNPVGPAVGFNAWMGEELAAHYATQPVFAEFNGKKTRGLLSLNTATHEKHRGKKLFTLLAEKTYEYGHELGYEFVIGVANANSTPGFIKKLGFSLICPLDVKFGIGMPANVRAVDFNYSRYWNRELLTWRLANPKLNYEIKQQEGQFVVLAPTGRYGIRAIIGSFPMELLPPEFRVTRRKGLNPVNIWMGLDVSTIWDGKCYFNFPDRFKPSPLNLIFRDLTGMGNVPHKEEIKFMSIDFDAY
ncbi:MAG TPA: GNAT family N-acetyltransferase [Bacteroidales bacterium]|nr:GNAT family N-acetyltransferase [Bacteroidales bacterium]